MARPVILGIVGDSASGKTTLTRGLVRLLGQDQVSLMCLDDYHRYDRSQRAGLDTTPLDLANAVKEADRCSAADAGIFIADRNAGRRHDPGHIRILAADGAAR